MVARVRFPIGSPTSRKSLWLQWFAQVFSRVSHRKLYVKHMRAASIYRHGAIPIITAQNGLFVSKKCQYSAVRRQCVVRNSLQTGALPISRLRVLNPLPGFFAWVDCRAAWCQRVLARMSAVAPSCARRELVARYSVNQGRTLPGGLLAGTLQTAEGCWRWTMGRRSRAGTGWWQRRASRPDATAVNVHVRVVWRRRRSP